MMFHRYLQFLVVLVLLAGCQPHYEDQNLATPTTNAVEVNPATSTATEINPIIQIPKPEYEVTPTPSPILLFEGKIYIWNRAHSSNMAGSNFPPNESVQVIVTARDGEVRSDTVFETSPTGELPIHNFEFLLAENNLITIKLAKEQVEFQYEYIYAFADPEQQEIHVFAKPYVPVNIEITNAERIYRRFEGYADEDGNFSVDTSAYLTWDEKDTITIGHVIHPNAEIQITQDSPLMSLPDFAESEWYVLDERRAPDVYSIGSLGEGYVVADLTHDGLDDLIYAGMSLGSQTLWDHVPVHVLVNDGSGNFIEGTQSVIQGEIPKVVHGHRMIVEDFNADGFPDVFIGDNGRDDDLNAGEPNILLLSNAEGKLVDASANLLSKPCTSRKPAYTGAPACSWSENKPLYEADGLTSPLPDWPHSLAADDIDGDGDVDIFVNNIGCPLCASTQYFLINDGTGVFMADYGIVPKEIRLAEGGTIYPSAMIVDMDGDTFPDLILGGDRGNARYGKNGYSMVFWNDGSGDFSNAEKTILPVIEEQVDPATIFGDPWYSGLITVVNVETMDVDNDSNLDILFTHGYRGRYIQLLINNGDRTFKDDSAIRLPQQPVEGVYYDRIEEIDINQDGYSDILAVNGNYPHAYQTEQIWVNDGSGHFKLLDFSVTGKLGVLIPIDADGDGGLDFLVLNCIGVDDPCQVQDFSLLANKKPLQGTLLYAPTPMPTPTPLAADTSLSEGTPIYSDAFDGTFDSEWNWIRAVDEQWNLADNPGMLHVNLAQVSDVYQAPPSTLLVRSIQEENFEIVTHIFFEPVRNFQKAGLVIYEDDENFVALLRAYVDVAGFPGNAIYFDNIFNSEADPQNFATKTSHPSEVYLKIRKVGDTYSAYYSEKGENWNPIGAHMSQIEPVSIGLLIGATDQPVSVDFDFFEIYNVTK
jgi:hypothetical protein